jgi:hypothetical protein
MRELMRCVIGFPVAVLSLPCTLPIQSCRQISARAFSCDECNIWRLWRHIGTTAWFRAVGRTQPRQRRFRSILIPRKRRHFRRAKRPAPTPSPCFAAPTTSSLTMPYRHRHLCPAHPSGAFLVAPCTFMVEHAGSALPVPRRVHVGDQRRLDTLRQADGKPGPRSSWVIGRT